MTVMLCLAVIAVFALGFGAWKHFHLATTTTSQDKQANKTNQVNYRPPTDAQKKAGDEIKQESLKNSNTDSNSSSDSGAPNSVTITIARLGQVSPGQNVNLRATLSGNVNNGQCVATFTKSGHAPVTVTTGIASDPTYYSCEPIDMSASQLSDGTWEASVYVQQSGKTISNAATGSVTVQQ